MSRPDDKRRMLHMLDHAREAVALTNDLPNLTEALWRIAGLESKD